MPADEGELVLTEAVWLLFGGAALADQAPEDDRKDGGAEGELAVDVFTAPGSGSVPNPIARGRLQVDAASDLSYSFSKAILIRGRSVNRGNRCVQQSQIDSQLSAMMGGMVED